MSKIEIVEGSFEWNVEPREKKSAAEVFAAINMQRNRNYVAMEAAGVLSEEAPLERKRERRMFQKTLQNEDEGDLGPKRSAQ